MDDPPSAGRSVTSTPSGRWWETLRGLPFQAVSLGLLLLVAYAANGDFLATSDALPNMYVPVSAIREGNLSFTPDEMPFMFAWTLRTGDKTRPVRVRTWSQRIEGMSAAELRREGRLQDEQAWYYVTSSSRAGEFVGIYGPGPGLAALPVYAGGMLVWGDLRERPGTTAWLGKLAASLFVAGSAILLFLTGVRTVSRRSAWILALAYGLGTCVWSQSSQALWQQTPVLLFLSIALWAWLKEPATGRFRAIAGGAVAAAVLCRPTWGILLVAMALWLLKRDRKGLVPFGLGAAGPLAILAGYAAYYLESFLDFGQMDAASSVALRKTGSMDVWQTPIWEGAAGILLSPSRGLLVFSPFLAFAAWGAWVVWRERSFLPLRPVSLALLGLLALTFRWFDWWGGHSFGYRLVVDMAPLFMVLLVPVADRLLSRPGTRWAFLTLAAWSVGVQVLGAFAYDQGGWNARLQGFEVRVPGQAKPLVAATPEEAGRLALDKGGTVGGEHALDVDLPEYRSRLWSLADNPISYYAAHFAESRAAKRSRLRAFLETR